MYVCTYVLESVQDFLMKLDMTMYASSGNKHFFTILCLCQTYQNYEQPPQTFQNSYFQSHFSVLNIGQIFPKTFSMKNIRLGDQLLLENAFEIFDF